MKLRIKRTATVTVILALLLWVSAVCITTVSAAEPDFEFRVSDAWIGRLTAGTDYDGVDHGASADLPTDQYYFAKFRVTGYLFIGNFDMDGIVTVTYDVTNSSDSEYSEEGRLLLAADKEGTQVIASSMLVGQCGWNTPKTGTFEVLDNTYSGPLYMVMVNGSGHEYQVANLKFFSTDPAVTEAPTEAPTEEPTEAPTDEVTEPETTVLETVPDIEAPTDKVTETDTPTPETTPADEADTTATDTTATNTTGASESGCGATVAASALLLLLTTAAWVARKRD